MPTRDKEKALPRGDHGRSLLSKDPRRWREDKVRLQASSQSARAASPESTSAPIEADTSGRRVLQSNVSSGVGTMRPPYATPDTSISASPPQNSRSFTSGVSTGCTSLISPLSYPYPGTPGQVGQTLPDTYLVRASPQGVNVIQAGAETRPNTQLSHDTRTRIASLWRFGPAQDVGGQKYIPKQLVKTGPVRTKKINDDDDKSDDDDSAVLKVLKGYKKQSRPERVFKAGCVIEVPQVPPPGASARWSAISPNRITDVRKQRYVIVKAHTEQSPNFQAVPIRTYNGQGVASQGVHKPHHCIIYTQDPNGGGPPEPTPDELPRHIPDRGMEGPMRSPPILVRQNDRYEKLDPLSRLDLFNVQPFDSGFERVRIFGNVEGRHLDRLLMHYRSVWFTSSEYTGMPDSRSTPPPIIAGPSNTQRRPSEELGGRSIRARQEDNQEARNLVPRGNADPGRVRTSASQTNQGRYLAEQREQTGDRVRNDFISDVEREYERLSIRAQEYNMGPLPRLSTAQLEYFASDANVRREYMTSLGAQIDGRHRLMQGRAQQMREQESSRAESSQSAARRQQGVTNPRPNIASSSTANRQRAPVSQTRILRREQAGGTWSRGDESSEQDTRR